jgi:hypothetical protein
LTFYLVIIRGDYRIRSKLITNGPCDYFSLYFVEYSTDRNTIQAKIKNLNDICILCDVQNVVLRAGSKSIDMHDEVRWTRDFHGGNYEKFYLLGYNAA